jgi:hypothetical protein
MMIVIGSNFLIVFLNDQLFQPLNISPMAGFFKRIAPFAYSYQYTTNALSSFNSGTHILWAGIFQGLNVVLILSKYISRTIILKN